MVKKSFLSTMICIILGFGIMLTGCATMIHTKQAKVVSQSGTSVPVQVLKNGVTIYEGTLPAVFPVKGDRTYSIIYTANGEKRTIAIAQKFNAWAIGSLLLGLLPIIIDIATGNIMQIERTTVIPISYSPMIFLGENIPYDSNLRIIGNIY